MIPGSVATAPPVGERPDNQVEPLDHGEMIIYGDRRDPIQEGGKVWLKLRPDGHTAWPSEWT
jgi:hypothetical protein